MERRRARARRRGKRGRRGLARAFFGSFRWQSIVLIDSMLRIGSLYWGPVLKEQKSIEVQPLSSPKGALHCCEEERVSVSTRFWDGESSRYHEEGERLRARRRYEKERSTGSASSFRGTVPIDTWLILPVVICLSQRLSHACLRINRIW